MSWRDRVQLLLTNSAVEPTRIRTEVTFDAETFLQAKLSGFLWLEEALVRLLATMSPSPIGWAERSAIKSWARHKVSLPL